jgi:prepilin-type N-terminal cleavage/methylation domain-containing protein
MTKKNNKKGFTLIETLVAISILSLSVLSTFAAVQSSLQFSNSTKDQIVAFFLVQDAMEFIKNIRDENALVNLSGGGNTWLSGLTSQPSDPCWAGGAGEVKKFCMVDSAAKTISFCGLTPGACPVLNINTPNGLMGYNPAWTPTNFTREIQFTTLDTDEVQVHVTIYWTTRGEAKTLSVSQLLFNRQ